MSDATRATLRTQIADAPAGHRSVIGGHAVAFTLGAGGAFTRDDGGAPLGDAALRALAAVDGQQLTYTCLPPGWSR